MITEKEIESVNLSATRKDFYQIWNELLETAGKLSERWSPESTNESDPGIVLLKVLTAIADKLNYTIDKNTLEAFMPSAAQEESMKKLCDMLGYNMKYYKSATTDITISYIGENALPDEGLIIPAYTNLKNNDEDINYFTISQLILSNDIKINTVECMEGEIVLCGEDTDGVISLAQIDDNNRYYLPESQIAENGIFIYNVDDSIASSLWEKVDNLNTQQVGALCYKFGFDSKLQQPYIQFPDDISTIIEDGLVIKYTRTNGANGNISYNTLSKLEAPDIWSDTETYDSEIYNTDNFAIKNASAATNGTNKESINDAYNSYKKTIGTFDTLVTCRDYINKIYQLTVSDTDTTPLVSNIVVSDIRDDINRAITLCTFNEYGIAYEDKSLKETNSTNDKITHFDLVLYPFTTISGSAVTNSNFVNSFKYSSTNTSLIEQGLETYKTISHKYNYPDEEEIACIKNYLKLKAKITTTSKVNTIEEKLILNNIYSAIYNNFNSRKIDFGEEIPFDTILEVIQNSDTRIKNVALEEPILYTKFCMANGNEYAYKDTTEDSGKSLYNKLSLRNILAGRINLFDYNEDFKPGYTETKYPSWKEGTETKQYDSVYGRKTISEKKCFIGNIESEFNLYNTGYKLNENEIIQFRAPNFKTTKTYPTYVNYFLHLTQETTTAETAVPATFGTLRHYMEGSSGFIGEQGLNKWNGFINSIKKSYVSNKKFEISSSSILKDMQDYETKYGQLFTLNTTTTQFENYTIPESIPTEDITLYYFEINSTTYGQIYSYIKSKNANYYETETTYAKLKGIFRNLGSDQSREIGYMINVDKEKFAYCYTQLTSTSPLDNYYIQVTFEEEETTTTGHTIDGFGRDADYNGIKADSDYQLNEGEWLLLNYTPSSTDDDGNTSTGDPITIVYKNNEIIRPNFDLIDSNKYRTAGHTPAKTSGYDLKDCPNPECITNANGIFTLGTNEQIELREQVIVTLNDSAVYIYWERNDDDQNIVNDVITFTYDEPIIVGDTTYQNRAYTLKEGEYFYYTDASKIDLAYYGNGTKIIKSANTPDFTKKKIDVAKLADKIASDGLLAALPWSSYKLTDEGSSIIRHINLQEFQYINLIEGDTLNELSLITSTTPLLNKDWYNHKVKIAKYTLSDSDITTELSKISVSGASWEARSILNINCAPKVIQTLHNSKDATDNLLSENKIKLHYYYYDDTNKEIEVTDTGYPIIITPILFGTAYTPLAFESNYLCQSSTGKADTHIYEYDDSGNIQNYVNDFAIKLFQESEIKGAPQTGTSTTVSMNNYGTGEWTKISFTDWKNIPLNINILNDSNQSINTRGLLMFYYVDTVTEAAKKAYLTVNNTTELKLNICNASNGSEKLFGTGTKTWWADHKLAVPAEESTYKLLTEEEFTKQKDNLYTREQKDITTSEKGYGNLKRLDPDNTGKYFEYTAVGTSAYSSITYYATLNYIGSDTVGAYHLRNGLNIVEIPASCELIIHAGTNVNGTLVFSDLDLVNYGKEKTGANDNFIINPCIDYFDLDEETAIEQVLSDIAKIDTDFEFYYNAVLDGSILIDLNTDAGEKLSDSIAWYDYNNVNNKFTISEIDADYLKTGITLTKSSRR